MSDMKFSETITANGNSSGYDVNGPLFFQVSGTWGSGTIKLEVYDTPNDAWLDIPGASWTADVATTVNFPPGANNVVRANLAGATGADLDMLFQSTPLYGT